MYTMSICPTLTWHGKIGCCFHGKMLRSILGSDMRSVYSYWTMGAHSVLFRESYHASH